MMDDSRSTRRGVVSCAAAALCFGAATPVSRRLLADLDPLTLAGLLYVGAALVAGPFAIRGRRARVRSADTDRWRLAVAVVIGGGVAPALLLAGLERVPAPTVSVLLNLELVATAVLATVVFGERVGRRGVFGIVLLLGSGALLAWQPGIGIDAAVLLVLAACVGWGIDNTTTAHLRTFSPAEITTAKGVVAGTVNVALGAVFGGAHLISFWLVLGALAVGALGYGVSIMLWISGAREIGAARGQAVFATAPFVGVLLAWPISGERLGPRSALACGVAAVGVVAVARTPLVRPHRHGAVTHSHEHRHDDLHHAHYHTPRELADGIHEHLHTHPAIEHVHEARHRFGGRHR